MDIPNFIREDIARLKWEESVLTRQQRILKYKLDKSPSETVKAEYEKMLINLNNQTNEVQLDIDEALQFRRIRQESHSDLESSSDGSSSDGSAFGIFYYDVRPRHI
ncbi:unnamed protein product [Blepharisma stoltei]|uniref:Uncharacterized protein n=1 Tax=Blepharisma stoltei TaxID=1481888 RepID=A0AAU9IRS1_9CILI|nr:unnamed protein product [Blepharisma stoltei]